MLTSKREIIKMLLCCLIWCKKDTGWAVSPPNTHTEHPPLLAKTIALTEEDPKETISPNFAQCPLPQPLLQLVERNSHQSVVV